MRDTKNTQTKISKNVREKHKFIINNSHFVYLKKINKNKNTRKILLVIYVHIIKHCARFIEPSTINNAVELDGDDSGTIVVECRYNKYEKLSTVLLSFIRVSF